MLRPPATRRAYLAVPLISLGMLAATAIGASTYGLGLRDPDGVVGARLVLVFSAGLVLWALDVVPRGLLHAHKTGEGVIASVLGKIRERWSVRRMAIVLGTIVAFYLTYLCYRNLKSYVPLARPELFDADLLEFERTLFGGDPATFLHDLLGTGISAHALSTIYLLFLTFVPLSVAAALVWSEDLGAGLWWVTALSLNWALGALSYFLIPSLGPVFAYPELFAALPETGATGLQEYLAADRKIFMAAPIASGELQSIAGFASLHISITLTGAMLASLLGAHRVLRITLWAFAGLTSLATLYLGWHYLVDDLGGIAIAVTSVYAGARMTGWRIERAATSPAHATASAT